MGELTGRPKGGVMFMSLRGTVLSTAACFQFDNCCPYRFQPAGDKQLNIRHSTAIAIAHWMGCKRIRGAMLARDDDGDVYILFPSPGGSQPPEAYRKPKPQT